MGLFGFHGTSPAWYCLHCAYLCLLYVYRGVTTAASSPASKQASLVSVVQIHVVLKDVSAAQVASWKLQSVFFALIILSPTSRIVTYVHPYIHPFIPMAVAESQLIQFVRHHDSVSCNFHSIIHLIPVPSVRHPPVAPF
ncbi:hypothetical protein F5884DRAFT_307193 [Xylogone sp. PMI_703]|nr:hypothetical protein F5884DRAFT_307193 [Xylogone sp. PMI_703]